MKRRLCAFVGLWITLLLFTTSPVAAGKPVKEFLAAPAFIDLAAGEVCDFAVRITVDINNEYGKTFFEGDTAIRTIINGRLVLTLIHMSPAGVPLKSVTINASGPGLVVYSGDIIRVTLRGRSLIFVPGEAPLFYVNSGQVVEEGSGAIQPVVLPVISQIGHRVDYCPLIA
jgi:hypothetical protein